MLSVLNVSYPFAAVGPDAVGGAEQVLTQLDAALVEAGHQSIVVAPGGQVRGILVPTGLSPRQADDVGRAEAWERHRAAIRLALCRWRVDVVHLHGIDFHAYLPDEDVPVLATLHLPPSWYPARIFQTTQQKVHLQCVSETQRKSCPDPRAVTVIPNGVPVEAFAGCRHAPRGFALAMGRICPEKGFHLAMEAASLANCPLLLAGEVFPFETHQRYYHSQIVPRLGPACRFIGPAGFRRKRRLLAAAECLLVPSLVQETSSLIAMEALACGTPVVAFRAGALPEIIDHGRTGFIVDDARQMAEAMREVGSLKREHCREVARQRFGRRSMTDRYLAAYAQLARKNSAGSSARPCNEEGSLCAV